eukprot:787759-Pleurochrysis_carterae.AAC.1
MTSDTEAVKEGLVSVDGDGRVGVLPVETAATREAVRIGGSGGVRDVTGAETAKAGAGTGGAAAAAAQ